MPEPGSDNKRRQKVTKRGIDSTSNSIKGKRKKSAPQLRREAWEKAGQQANEASQDQTATGALVSRLAGLEGAEPGAPGMPAVDVNVNGRLEPGQSLESVQYLDVMRKTAREHSLAALNVMVSLMGNEKVPPMVRWRAAVSVVEIAEREPGRGAKRVGELTAPELRALRDALVSQERNIDGEATVIPDDKPLTDQGQQPDAQSSRPDGDQDAAPEPEPARARVAID